MEQYRDIRKVQYLLLRVDWLKQFHTDLSTFSNVSQQEKHCLFDFRFQTLKLALLDLFERLDLLKELKITEWLNYDSYNRLYKSIIT